MSNRAGVGAMDLDHALATLGPQESLRWYCRQAPGWPARIGVSPGLSVSGVFKRGKDRLISSRLSLGKRVLAGRIYRTSVGIGEPPQDPTCFRLLGLVWSRLLAEYVLCYRTDGLSVTLRVFRLLASD